MIDKIDKKISPVPPDEIIKEIAEFIAKNIDSAIPPNSVAFAAEQVDNKTNMTTTILTISTVEKKLVMVSEAADGTFQLPESSEWTLTLVRKGPVVKVLGNA